MITEPDNTMAGSGDLIDFNVIESHKENIQALPSGRSAKALAQLYSPPLLGANPSPSNISDAHTKERSEFEKELLNIDEADDPLDVYDRYVKWTMDTYPSAQATPQSQLLPLLERATKNFQSSAHYKNDPRYLKMWLHYIRLFSDAPREAFVFLARHNIGESLALYYEEFAAWLENAGRWNQAEEIYKMGLEKEARPAERLMRKFGEFERRKDARPQDDAEPTSPALPAVRAALAAKIDPFAATTAAPEEQQQARPAAAKKGKAKMAIFTDAADESSRPSSGNSSKGWDNIGSLADRKKENTVEAKPWQGETLKVGKTNGGMPKMMVFKDESSLPTSLPKHVQKSLSSENNEDQCARNPRTGRMECVFVNLEAVYPEPNKRPAVEYCFEELRARHRGWLNRDWRRSTSKSSTKEAKTEEKQARAEKMKIHVDEPVKEQQPQPSLDIDLDEPKEQPKPKQRGFAIFEDLPSQPPAPSTSKPAEDEKVLVEKFSKQLALNDENNENNENDENAPPSRHDADLARKLRREERREERANRTRKIQVMDVQHIKNETKTIQLNLESPTGPKIKRKKSSADRPEPTMTINTKEAMDEIYGIFNQPLPSQADQSDEEEEDSDEDEDSEDEYTTDAESTGTGKLSGVASDYGDETRNEILGSQKTAEGAEDDGRTDVSAWSDFTTSKHVPKEDEEDDETSDGEQSEKLEVFQDENESHDEELATPGDERPRTRYVLVPPEDYEPPTGQFRDMAVVANNRLPFMTPIVEHTESSLGTVKTAEKDYYNSKTPSRKTGFVEPLPEDDEEPCSSPFQEDFSEIAEEKRKILQPIRTKSTKGTISLGQGTAQSQTTAAKAKGTAVDDAPLKGPIIHDGQCNPMDPQLRQTILESIRPPLASYEGYHDHVDIASGRTPEIRKYIKTLMKARSNPDKTASTLSLPPTLTFAEGAGHYTLKRELGAGTFAPVYLVQNSTAEQDAANETSHIGKSTHRKILEAVKMEDPPSAWEFYMLQQSHRRLGVSRAAESIVRAHEMHVFSDECFLVEEYRDQGTLLDLVNIARLDGSNSTGGGMDEVLAMWLTIELLRTTEALHAKGLIHGDIKGDNVLVRFDDPGLETDWSPRYFPSGAHGWSSKGMCLIDFGRGIDMRHFSSTVGFIADWKTTEADCAEMRELRPWTYQVDYHGIAGVIHSMLFGKYMETIAEKGASSLGAGAAKTYRIRESFKRYWQTEIWSEVFALLLNPLAHVGGEQEGKMPVLRGLRGCRERMEGWLEENCERGVGLQGMIVRMEGAIRERKRKSAR